jgi:hypothetical protein
MKELLNSPWEYILYQDDKGRYILSVLCGSVATYELNIPLEASEEKAYRLKGKEYIQQLVSQIQYSPVSYKERHIAL